MDAKRIVPISVLSFIHIVIFMAEGCGLSGGRQSEQQAQGGKLVN